MQETQVHSLSGPGKSPGEGSGYPLQYSCLENPMDRGAWQAQAHGVAKSQTWLSTHTPTSQSLLIFSFPVWLPSSPIAQRRTGIMIKVSGSPGFLPWSEPPFSFLNVSPSFFWPLLPSLTSVFLFSCPLILKSQGPWDQTADSWGKTGGCSGTSGVTHRLLVWLKEGTSSPDVLKWPPAAEGRVWLF